MTPKATELTEKFELIAIAALAESTANPRKTFNPPQLAELTASIAEKGVIEPIIARPHPKPKGAITHEIVAGARRFRASKDAKKETIPAIVRPRALRWRTSCRASSPLFRSNRG